MEALEVEISRVELKYKHEVADESMKFDQSSVRLQAAWEKLNHLYRTLNV